MNKILTPTVIDKLLLSDPLLSSMDLIRPAYPKPPARCPKCNSTDLDSPLDYSEDGGVEDWWCNRCNDFVPDPAGYSLKEKKKKALRQVGNTKGPNTTQEGVRK